MKVFLLLIFSGTLQLHFAFSQDSTFYYSTDIQGAISTPHIPLWLHSNTNGIIPANGSYLSGRLGISKIYNIHNPRILQWAAGAELITNAGKSGNVFFTDFFLAAKLGEVELSIGQRKEYMGLADSSLSSGTLATGSNFRPYPKIQLYTPQFVNVIPGSDIIAVKFSYSDGILGSANVHYGEVSEVPQIYLHQKSLYARLGGRHSKINLFAGFNHQAIWGGEDRIFTDGLKKSLAYKYVVFGKPWGASRVGNHFGTIDLAIELKTNSGTLFLYRQSIYEDGSLIKLANISDGLSGLRFKRKKIETNTKSLKFNTALVEFIYTKNQGGDVFDYKTGVFGKDNYFNHYIYTQGWSYKGRSLGTPLISSQALIRDNLTHESTVFTANNRLLGFHGGINANWQGFDIVLKATYSQNYGTYNLPFKKKVSQTSFLISFQRMVSIWKKSIVSVSLASDIGQLYPNNSAISIGWKKFGFIR